MTINLELCSIQKNIYNAITDIESGNLNSTHLAKTKDGITTLLKNEDLPPIVQEKLQNLLNDFKKAQAQSQLQFLNVAEQSLEQMRFL